MSIERSLTWEKQGRINVLIALWWPFELGIQGISVNGVNSWARWLRAQMSEDPEYRVMLLGCCRGKTQNKPAWIDYWATSPRQARAVVRAMAPLILVPNGVYDLLHVVAPMLDKMRPIQVLGVCHSDSLFEFYEPISWYERLFSRLVAVSRKCEKELVRRVPSRQEEIDVLPYAVEAPVPLQRSYQVDPIRLIYGGRLVNAQKRVLDLVALAKALLQQRVNFTLDIFGEGRDQAQLAEEIEKLAHRGRVRLRGAASPECMPAIWAAHDVFVQTSEYEGTSLSMLEAMAQGTVPVVTQVSSGVPDVVITGKNGFVVPIGGMSAMASVIAKVTDHPELLASIGRAAHRTVLEKHSPAMYLTQFRGILRAVRSAPIRRWPNDESIEAPRACWDRCWFRTRPRESGRLDRWPLPPWAVRAIRDLRRRKHPI